MLTDFLYYLVHTFILAASIILARGAVQTHHEGTAAWKACGASLILTSIVWCFVCEVLEIQYKDHFGKLLALCLVQALAFVWFRATLPAKASI